MGGLLLWSAGVDFAGELAFVSAVTAAGVAPGGCVVLSAISLFARRTFPCTGIGRLKPVHAHVVCRFCRQMHACVHVPSVITFLFRSGSPHLSPLQAGLPDARVLAIELLVHGRYVCAIARAAGATLFADGHVAQEERAERTSCSCAWRLRCCWALLRMFLAWLRRMAFLCGCTPTRKQGHQAVALPHGTFTAQGRS